MTSDTGYDADFFLWTQAQAERLRVERRRGTNPIDYVNVAEEIESLGKRDRRELESRLETILTHLFKLAAAPAKDPRRGWKVTVARERRRVQRILADSPSLCEHVNTSLPAIVQEARQQAAEDLLAFNEDAEAVLLILGINDEVVERMLEDDFFPHPPEPAPTSESA